MLFLIEEFSSSCQQSLTTWRSLLGVMSSLSALIPGARLRMQSLQLLLNVACPHASEDALVSWDDSCLQDLWWWYVVGHLEVGVPLNLPRPDLLYTDTSLGLGCVSRGKTHLSALWTPVALTFSINHRELLAVLLAVRGFLHQLANQSVALFSVNTTALPYLCKEVVPVPPASTRWLRPFFACARHTLCICSPSLFRAPSTSSRILSVGARRFWALKGPSARFARNCFVDGRSPSTSVRPPSTIDFPFISL